MEYEGQLTEHDFVKAYHLHSRAAFRREFAFWAIASGVLLVLQRALVPHLNFVAAVVAVGLPGAMLNQRFILIPRALRREFRQNSQIAKPFCTRAEEDGLETSQGESVHRRSWSDFKSWREDDTYILLYESDLGYGVIPKRVFQSQSGSAEFRELLTRKLGIAR